MGNAVYAHKETSRRHPRHRYGRAATSARAIKLKQRKAECLNYRLQGHSFADIGRAMHINPKTAYRYVVACLVEVVPHEEAKTVLAQELERLNEMQSAIYPEAAKGDRESIEAVLSIMRMRAKYLGLHPEKPSQALNFNIGGGQNAEVGSFQIEFVKPDPNRWPEERERRAAEAAKLVDGRLLELPDQGQKH